MKALSSRKYGPRRSPEIAAWPRQESITLPSIEVGEPVSLPGDATKRVLLTETQRRTELPALLASAMSPPSSEPIHYHHHCKSQMGNENRLDIVVSGIKTLDTVRQDKRKKKRETCRENCFIDRSDGGRCGCLLLTDVDCWSHSVRNFSTVAVEPGVAHV